MESFAATFGGVLDANPLLALILAFFAGLVSAFGPCTLTSVPLIMAYVGGYARDDQRRAFVCSLVFCAGLAVTFTSLGALAAILGRIMSGFGKRWYIALGLFTILLGLWMMGVVNLPVPSVASKRSFRRSGLPGAFALGVVAGAISSPCSTPVLAAILALVAGKGDLVLGVSLLGAYSVGHCALALVAGTSVAFVDRLARSERTERIGGIARFGLGVLVLLAGLYLFYTGI
ncbi:MAG: cytochrome c biogenesis protein CcdA [Firmicutes bacterium]|nr:cytochrome c biogenesis protein CcdA [Bacillota bacterium]MDH7496304.1 cytochrome c biogenesis protein CcdA [Bacillota bacterium]